MFYRDGILLFTYYSVRLYTQARMPYPRGHLRAFQSFTLSDFFGQISLISTSSAGVSR